MIGCGRGDLIEIWTKRKGVKGHHVEIDPYIDLYVPRIPTTSRAHIDCQVVNTVDKTAIAIDAAWDVQGVGLDSLLQPG